MTKKMAIEIVGFVRDEYKAKNFPLYTQAMEMAIKALEKQPALYGYSDLEKGDRVIMLGTVTAVSESGVETIMPDMDEEGYVVARQITLPKEGEER